MRFTGIFQNILDWNDRNQYHLKEQNIYEKCNFPIHTVTNKNNENIRKLSMSQLKHIMMTLNNILNL